LLMLPTFANSQIDKVSNRLKAKIQTEVSSEPHLVWIYFTDKGNDLQKFYSNPESVVSEKSLKRRYKVLAKNKAIDFLDLPVNEDYVDQLFSAGFILKHRSKWFNAVSGFANTNQINEISVYPFVKKIDIVEKFSTRKDDVEFIELKLEPELNKSSEPNRIHSLNYGTSFTQMDQINVPAVHDLGYTGQGITICLMDAGFSNLSHEAFSSMNIIAMWDFVENDPDVSGHSHGTGTLSTIGGFKEGQLIGPAFSSDYILARTENDPASETPLEEDNWIAALEWADSIGVDVTSTSLGYLTFDSPYTSYTWEDMDGNTARITIASDLAAGKGIVVVNSAGNSGLNTSHNTLNAPADGDSVFTIGAVTSSGTRSSFSSVGPTVDGRTKPDLMAMGSSVYMASVDNTADYIYDNGTSFSCPLVAGVCALLLNVNPSLTPMQILETLRLTASQSNSPDNLYGWGIVNALDAINILITRVDEKNNPENFYLLSNYPNPFNPNTRVVFSVPKAEKIRITLHDMLGREIKTLFNEFSEAGIQELTLNGSDLASGVYLIRMATESIQKSHKISLIK
ncbi:MAG: S8 family peptidase, partial [Ignavibacteriaceae bacterium]|nr:S8 family peptidase [Ignavibacteriaceae bacterium]